MAEIFCVSKKLFLLMFCAFQLSLDEEQGERKDAGLKILTSWYSLRSTGDLLSDEEIHLASLMPNRLLKAIARELSGSIGWSSQSGDSPRII